MSSHGFENQPADEAVGVAIEAPPAYEAPPPIYTPLNEVIHEFSLKWPFIYAKGSSTFARYQLAAQYSKSGRPFRLRLRRLLASESRRIPDPMSDKTAEVHFDEDMTLYMVESKTALSLVSMSTSIQIRGRQSSTLQGYVEVQPENRKCSFWHITRNAARDSLKEENEKYILKHGYHPGDEINKCLLFCAKRPFHAQHFEWRNAQGEVVAVENEENLRITKQLEVRKRDLLVTCWMARCWSKCKSHGDLERG